MIKKIKSIKNLGIFSDYSWDSSLPDFERYNLFYGWNGSGKTTLSKIFSFLEQGKSDEFPSLEYSITTEDGDLQHGDIFNGKIKVFNQDYVKNNVELLGGTAKPIFILGEDNQAIVREIEKDRESLEQIKKKKEAAEKEKKEKEEKKGKIFTDVAKDIGEATRGATVRNYNKTHAQRAFEKLKPEILTEEEQSEYRTTLQQEAKDRMDELVVPATANNEILITEHLSSLFSESEVLCSRTVESVIIERLKSDREISSWVETGLLLHQKHQSKECEFCGQALSDVRIKELTGHFNAADQALKSDIDAIIEELRSIRSKISEMNPRDKANLYDELRDSYQTHTEEFIKKRDDLIYELDSLVKILEDKKSKTTEVVQLNTTLDIQSFEVELGNVNHQIKLHNAKTDDFASEKEKAKAGIENHFLSEIVKDVSDLEKEIQGLARDIGTLRASIDSLEKNINENQGVISSEHKACEALNEKLETFLGRSEIMFEVANEGGYTIKRKGKVARSLSEGEKTAIAFVYFVVHLKDKDFDLSKGVVVIDDPISSLDANSLFQAFAFLKNAVKDAGQVFLLTHNFDFLKLLLNWLKNVKNSVGKKSYYMIKNQYELGDDRSAHITKLDEELKNHESEYHFLCKILLEFEPDGSISSAYHIPNIARKVLETFLMFRVPSGESLFSKLKKLDFDESKKSAIYDFVNDQSHSTGGGFDPSLVKGAEKNVPCLLEMMEKVSPDHFQILKESIETSGKTPTQSFDDGFERINNDGSENTSYVLTPYPPDSGSSPPSTHRELDLLSRVGLEDL